MLLIPESLIDSYQNDMKNAEKLEIMDVIFSWYYGEIVEPKHKTTKILMKQILPILESHKTSYEKGLLGGAPKGNMNAKKTTPLVLENNPKTTPLEILNNPESTQIENPSRKEKEKEKEKDKEKDNDKDKEIDFFSKEAQDAAEIELNKLANKIFNI